MKISQKQASLLAREVHKKLTAKKVGKASPELQEQLKKFVARRRQLSDKVADARDELNKFENTLFKITGKIERLYAGDSFDQIIRKVEEKNIPSVSQIEVEIILQAMFTNEDAMDAFISSIVEKFSKKLVNKVLQN